MELTGIKCNECGTRAFLEDPDSPEWATCQITVPSLRLQFKVHYCPECRDRLLDKVGNPNEQLTTAQHRVIDPSAPNRELEAAIGAVNPEIDHRNDRDLERAGLHSPPRGMPVVPPGEHRGPRETVPAPVVLESSVNGPTTGELPVTRATSVVPDPTDFWAAAPPGDGGTHLAPPPRRRPKGEKTRARVRKALQSPRVPDPRMATFLVPVVAVLHAVGL